MTSLIGTSCTSWLFISHFHREPSWNTTFLLSMTLQVSGLYNLYSLDSKQYPTSMHFSDLLSSFLMPVWRNESKCNTHKHSKIAHIRFSTMPYLIRCFPIQSLSWWSINQVYSRWSCFSPELCWQITTLEHPPFHLHNNPILTLHHTILLWCVWGRGLPLDSKPLAVYLKLIRRELTSMVTHNCLEPSSCLLFH